MKPPLIGLVIVSYNAAGVIEACLNSVTALTYPNLLTIVVDNASADETKKIIRTIYPELRLVENKQNTGFAYATNQGIKLLLEKKCDYILLLNPDTVVKPELLEHLIEPFHDETVGITGPAITYHGSQKIWFAGGSFHSYFCYTRHDEMNQSVAVLTGSIRTTDFITGCCMLIRSSVFKKITFLDPQFEYYFEDVDFCLRARRAGYNSAVIEVPLVSHRVSSSAGIEGSNRLSPFKAYYYGRNPFLLMKHHLHGWRRIPAVFGQFCIRLPFYGFQMLINKDIRSLFSYLHGIQDGIVFITTRHPEILRFAQDDETI